VYVGQALGRKWAESRFKGPYLRNALWEHGYSVDTIETAVDWPEVKNLMLAMERTAHEAFAEFGMKVWVGTHLSHVYSQGSSVYSTFIWPTAPGGFAPNLELWRHYKERVSAVIAAHGGTVSHHHGVGRDHAAFLHVEKGPLGMATLAELCRHFDPKRIMNPGKLLVDGEKWAH
jgi:alkyldihydroxyacetonephosphate synthase